MGIDYKDLNLSEEDLDELQYQLNSRKSRNIYEENIKAIDDNKKYIGKCFKEKKRNKYLRVLSSKSSNQFRAECMCFEFPVEFHENHRLTKIFNPDNAFSTIDFEGIYVEDYPLFCSSWGAKPNGIVLNTLEEISEEEYFTKMNEYIASLQEKVKEGFFDTSKGNKSMFKRD